MIQAAIIISFETPRIYCEWYRDDCEKQLQIRDKVKQFTSEKTLIEKNYEVLNLDSDLKLQ